MSGNSSLADDADAVMNTPFRSADVAKSGEAG
jgi:hypothetical protein